MEIILDDHTMCIRGSDSDKYILIKGLCASY